MTNIPNLGAYGYVPKISTASAGTSSKSNFWLYAIAVGIILFLGWMFWQMYLGMKKELEKERKKNEELAVNKTEKLPNNGTYYLDGNTNFRMP